MITLDKEKKEKKSFKDIVLKLKDGEHAAEICCFGLIFMNACLMIANSKQKKTIAALNTKIDDIATKGAITALECLKFQQEAKTFKQLYQESIAVTR